MAGNKNDTFEPAYLELKSKNKLKKLADRAQKLLASCRLCPRECGVNRLEGETGFCSIGEEAIVSSAFPHRGEEQPISGRHGSGTIFFAGCNLKCVFCQNFSVSHRSEGEKLSTSSLARKMLVLQERNCHNINFVSPTHLLPQVLMALVEAAEEGLKLPLVYNSGGYEKTETLKQFGEIFDIFMPDFKFWDSRLAEKYMDAPNYPERAREALRWMDNQVGQLETDKNNLARRGLLIRHLVMPGQVADSKKILEWIEEELSAETYVNIMPQYRPAGRAENYPQLQHSLRREEYRQVRTHALDIGLSRLD